MVKKSKSLLVPGLPAQITKLIEGESDRGAILILGAYLDELLADLVRSACISDEAGDALLEFRRPAGDFDSRIELCTAWGLIHHTERDALHTLRRIRNAAAHFDKKGRGFEVLFDSEATVNQVASLAKAVNLSLDSRDPKRVRHVFIVCCRFLAMRLIFRSIMAARPEEPPTLKEIANFIRAQLKGTPQGERLQTLEDAITGGQFETLQEFLKEAVARHSSRMTGGAQDQVAEAASSETLGAEASPKTGR